MEEQELWCDKCGEGQPYDVIFVARPSKGHCPFFHHDTGLCGCSDIGGDPKYKDEPCPAPGKVILKCSACGLTID
jgi:hypothetical protein